MRCLIASMAAAGTLLVGLLATDATPVARAAPSVGVVGCSAHVEAGGRAPSEAEIREARRTSVVVGAVTLWGLRRARGHAFGSAGAGGDDGWKAGVSVHGHRPVTVAVAARDRRWLGLDYVRRPVGHRVRRVAEADSVVRFEPCPPGTRSFTDGRPLGARTGWAGGFVVARPGCATLLVRAAGAVRSTRVRVGFGVRCR
jgi:hypothetical protein